MTLDDPFDMPQDEYRAMRRERRRRERMATSHSRGIGPDSVPDGPVWHHDGCFLRPLHLGDCKVLAPPSDLPTPTIAKEARATEMAPAEEAVR